MAEKDLCNRLADRLHGILAGGLPVSDETLFFAESTYGLEPYDLQGALTDEDFEGREALLRLVVFPERSVRLAVEPYLDNVVFDPGDQAHIASRLAADHDYLELHLPEGRAIRLPFEADMAGYFVEKLYLGRHIESGIGSALKEHLPDAAVISARIALRCGNYILSVRAWQFLALFVRQAAVRPDIFLALFEFILPVLEQVPENKAIGSWLLEQQKAQKKLLRTIQEFEQKREQYGMEYLLMQKYPVPADSEELVDYRLQLFSVIIDELLGISPAPDGFIVQRDLGALDPENDIEKLFNLLR